MTDLDTGADLHALMDRALADLDTPTTRIHDGSVRRGRTARRRRRAGAVLGGVAAAAVVTALVLPSLTGSPSTEGSVAHDSGTEAPHVDGPPAGWWDMPGARMRDRLAGLLPQGLSITDANLGNEDLAPGDEPHGGWLQVDVANAAGRPAGGVNVLLYAAPGDGGEFVHERTTCPGNLIRPDLCSEQYDDAGDLVGRSSRWAAGGVVVLEVTRFTPDGALVYLAASNSSDDKWGRGSATDGEQPPVTLAQLRRIAEDPAWQR